MLKGWKVAARSRPIPAECLSTLRGSTAVRRRKPERRGRVLRERKLETGVVPRRTAQDQRTARSTAVVQLCHGPHRAPRLPRPRPQPREPQASLVTAPGCFHRPQGEDAGPGPKAAAGRGAARSPQLASTSAPRVSGGRAGPRPRRGAGLWVCVAAPGPVARRLASGQEVPPRSRVRPPGARVERALGPPGVKRSPGMRAGAEGAQPGDPVRWPPMAIVEWDSVLFPGLLEGRLRKRVQFFSVFKGCGCSG